MARRRHKKRTQPAPAPARAVPSGQQPVLASASRVPKTMVIRIGASDVGASVSALVRDTRRMMEPHTAARLRERRSNKLKDYVTMAGPLGVTQLLLFSRSEKSGATTLRIARTPRGPTIHFRVNEYSLCRDVRRGLRNPRSPAGKEFASPPLLVMNNFASAGGKNEDAGTPAKMPPQDALLTSMFQGLFPPLSPQRTPLSSVRRVLCLNRVPAAPGSSEYVIDVRHYAIATKAVGVSRPIRRLNAAERALRASSSSSASASHTRGDAGGKRALPNLGKLDDIADFMLDPAAAAAGGYTSESEVEEEAEVEVMGAPARAPRKKKDSRGPEKRAVKLLELGPRMTLEMVKIEEGLAEGKTLWHAFEKKSPEEVRALEERHAKRRREKEVRRKAQEENVRRKKEAKERTKGEKGADDEDEDEDEDEEMYSADEGEFEDEDEDELDEDMEDE